MSGRAARAALLLLATSSAAALGDGGWEQLSQCTGWVSLNQQYEVLGNATVEVDVAADSFASRFNMNGTEAIAGNTRVQVTAVVRFGGAPLAAGATLVAHLHAGRCAAAGGPHYLQNVSGADDALPSPPPSGTGQGVNTFSVRVRSGVTNAATQAFLVDYDRALSVVLHEGGASTGYTPTAAGSRAACCDLVPNLPDLPDEWSATIECNFAGDGKAYTMVRQEFFSATQNKMTLVQHSNLLRSVEVTDLTKNVSYTLSQNATYPNGLCVATPIRAGPGQQMTSANGRLRSTADFLQFDPTQPIAFDGVNVKNVRGISCERWSRNFSFQFGPEVASGVAFYYFPLSSWSNRGESFHRLLKRVEVNGTHVSANGAQRAFAHSYEFVNMVPAITNADVFNPCYVLQSGGLGVSRAYSVTGCGCDKKPGAAPPPAKGSACSAGSLAALGILLPLFTLGIGAAVGVCITRKSGRVSPGAHERLRDEVALT